MRLSPSIIRFQISNASPSFRPWNADSRIPARSRLPQALDAGCGTGFPTALLERLGYGAHGVDVSPGLLAVARRRLPAAALALASVEALPYRDRHFDVATCCGSTLSFVDAPARAL